jgi:hypothetical protein
MNHQEKKLWKKLKAVTKVKMMFRFGAVKSAKINAPHSDSSDQTGPDTSPVIDSSTVATPDSKIAKTVEINSVNLADMDGSSGSSSSDSFYESGEDEEVPPGGGCGSSGEKNSQHQVQIARAINASFR